MWPVGRNRVRCLSCCECNPLHFILSTVTHLGGSPRQCVFVSVWTYVQTATCTEPKFHLVLVVCSDFQLIFGVFRATWSSYNPAQLTTDPLWQWLTGIYITWALLAEKPCCKNHAVSGHQVMIVGKSGRSVKERQTGLDDMKQERGGRTGKRSRRLMEEELPLGY